MSFYWFDTASNVPTPEDEDQGLKKHPLTIEDDEDEQGTEHLKEVIIPTSDHTRSFSKLLIESKKAKQSEKKIKLSSKEFFVVVKAIECHHNLTSTKERLANEQRAKALDYRKSALFHRLSNGDLHKIEFSDKQKVSTDASLSNLVNCSHSESISSLASTGPAEMNVQGGFVKLEKQSSFISTVSNNSFSDSAKRITQQKIKAISSFLYYSVQSHDMMMVVDGLVGATSQIGYILLLLLIIMYIYAVAGMMLFGLNDAWNFSRIDFSMLVMMRILTFDSWGDIFYTNYYGCDVYQGGLDPKTYTNNPALTENLTGGIMYCKNAAASPYAATLFFVSFIFLAGFGVLSSIIGMVGHSMERSIFKARQIDKENNERTGRVEEQIDVYLTNLRSAIYHSRVAQTAIDLMVRVIHGKKYRRGSIRYDAFITGIRGTEVKGAKKGTFYYYWAMVSHLCHLAAIHPILENSVTATIVLVAIVAGLDTDKSANHALVAMLNDAVQVIFTADCVLKILGEPFPWFFFYDGWNVFDFFIVAVSYIPLTGGGGLVLLLRLLRLFRLLKLMRRLEALQIILDSISSSLKAILLVTGFMMLYATILAAIGFAMFSRNDPVHFKDMTTSFITLIQVMTLDSWSLVMYINLFGCDVFGYEGFPDHCTQPKAQYGLSAAYFPFVVATLTWILMTMFIGVMMTGAEESLFASKKKQKVNKKLEEVRLGTGVTDEDIDVYRTIFDFLDFFALGHIGPIEIDFALKMSGLSLDNKHFLELWFSFPKERQLHLDFAEFVVIMNKLRSRALIFKRILNRLKNKVLTDEELKHLLVLLIQNSSRYNDHGTDLSEVFYFIDDDGNGVIELHELAHFANSCLPGISKACIRQIMHGFDKNGNGLIDETEFKEFIQGNYNNISFFTPSVTGDQIIPKNSESEDWSWIWNATGVQNIFPVENGVMTSSDPVCLSLENKAGSFSSNREFSGLTTSNTLSSENVYDEIRNQDRISEPVSENSNKENNRRITRQPTEVDDMEQMRLIKEIVTSWSYFDEGSYIRHELSSGSKSKAHHRAWHHPDEDRTSIVTQDLVRAMDQILNRNKTEPVAPERDTTTGSQNSALSFDSLWTAGPFGQSFFGLPIQTQQEVPAVESSVSKSDGGTRLSQNHSSSSNLSVPLQRSLVNCDSSVVLESEIPVRRAYNSRIGTQRKKTTSEVIPRLQPDPADDDYSLLTSPVVYDDDYSIGTSHSMLRPKTSTLQRKDNVFECVVDCFVPPPQKDPVQCNLFERQLFNMKSVKKVEVEGEEYLIYEDKVYNVLPHEMLLDREGQPDRPDIGVWDKVNGIVILHPTMFSTSWWGLALGTW